MATGIGKTRVEYAILKTLTALEDQHKVSILFAVEAGSRAWGFPSPDSDYDVRFVYSHPLNWYLRATDGRDVIEHAKGELDVSGWDIRKAAKLFKKGNPSLFEWLNSPTVYWTSSAFIGLQRLRKEFFNPAGSIYHYYHMARNNYRNYLRGDRVQLKKYLYVLRPLFAIEHILLHNTPPPVKIDVLTHGIQAQHSDDFWMAWKQLLWKKVTQNELGEGAKIGPLSDYIREHMRYWEENRPPKRVSKPRWDSLDYWIADTVLYYEREATPGWKLRGA